jgi:polar amino acid transport system substrate-binding protein
MKIGAYPMKNGEIDSSRRITTISYFLYKNKSTPIQWDDDSKKILHLKGKVCAPLGYSIVNNLKNWGIPVIEKTRCYDCFALVSLKNPLVSCVATLEFDGDSYLHMDDNRIKNIEKVNPPLIRKPYYLMLSHQFVRIHPALAEKIWDTIAIIRENEFNKIMEKYL